jgi:hypothetical protein
MKRNQPTKSNQASGKPRILESRRLASARGGTDLGIAAAHRPLAEDIMTQQHNEALIRI